MGQRVEDIISDELGEMARVLINSCLVNIPRAQIRVSVNNCRVINSNGVDCGHRGILVYGHFTPMAVGNHPGEGMEIHRGTHLDIDLPAIDGSLVRQARVTAGNRESREASA